MLQAIPQSWLSWDFTVLQGEVPIADIDVSRWREKGELTVAGATYRVYREGLLSGTFVLESAGGVLARAKKTTFFRSFLVEHAGRQYTLRAKSAFRRQLVLLEGAEGSREIGSISPAGLFTRRASVDLPEELPLAVRVFLIWLTIVLWKRESDAAAAG